MIGLGNVLLVLLGAGLGFLLAWLMSRPAAASLKTRLSLLQQELERTRAEAAKTAQLRSDMATLETKVAMERKAIEEKVALLNQMEEKLRESFQALSAEALKSNNQAFLHLAHETLGKFHSEAQGDLELRQQAVENLVAPIGESLKKVDEQIREIEKTRHDAYGGLREQVKSLIATQEKLQSETGNLVRALRTPIVRGRWGEIQLRRVVEIAGMLPYCDFVEQETVTTAAGRLRPDLVVKLPGGKSVVVDAKTPSDSYFDAIAATTDDIRRQKLLEHARQVRNHMTQLSSKAYQEQFEHTPDFVVMFLPGETFFSAALEHEPGLIEFGMSQNVVLASPTTLIALLRAVAYGWNQEKLARNAREISALGKELHDRLRKFGGYMKSVGKELDTAVEAYNAAVGSLESRVMVSARKFAELGATVTEEITSIEPIEKTTRNLTLEFDDTEQMELPQSTEPSEHEDTAQSKKAFTSKASD
ncbi:MAG TPA: DNA recombination protein RmuC [Candidatus Angelobacter sp.]|nr:DNA recombination protein RmuC [Candidatus Angelobacter sp.]